MPAPFVRKYLVYETLTVSIRTLCVYHILDCYSNAMQGPTLVFGHPIECFGLFNDLRRVDICPSVDNRVSLFNTSQERLGVAFDGQLVRFECLQSFHCSQAERFREHDC